jgi:hypothetical protein
VYIHGVAFFAMISTEAVMSCIFERAQALLVKRDEDRRERIDDGMANYAADSVHSGHGLFGNSCRIANDELFQ